MAKQKKSICVPADNRKSNHNRKLLAEYDYMRRSEDLREKSRQALYRGNPVHKVKPGDFGLQPPCYPASGHMKCDLHGHIECLADARDLLRKGLAKGFVDAREEDGWPVHVWAVKGDIVFEAKYSRHKTYHGYPAQQNDAFAKMIKRLWGLRNAG